MFRRHPFLRVADGHGQLELAKGADRPPGRIGDLHVRIQVHVGCAQMSDGEGVAAEVHSLEAVVHHQLGAHRVIDPGTKQEGLAVEQFPHAGARMGKARGGHRKAVGQQRAAHELTGDRDGHRAHRGFLFVPVVAFAVVGATALHRLGPAGLVCVELGRLHASSFHLNHGRNAIN